MVLPYELISEDSIMERLEECRCILRDGKDAHILASVLLENPDYVLTGDRVLREDLNRYLGEVRAVTSSEFLEMLGVE